MDVGEALELLLLLSSVHLDGIEQLESEDVGLELDVSGHLESIDDLEVLARLD